MRILGIDYGDARTGLASCDKYESIASPYGVIFEWNFENGCQRTVTCSYHKGVMSQIGCIEYHNHWEKPQKKYEGEITHQGLPDGLGTWTTKTHEGWDNFSTKTIYGIWENGECIKELFPLVYLFYKIKKIIKK